MRRGVGLLLCLIGIVATVVGATSGCGSLFAYNGRHPIAVYPLRPGTPARGAFPAKEGTRYTLAVHVVFEREGLPEVNGQVVVEARLPLAAAIEDASGVPVAKVVGWIDPAERPTVLYGHASAATQRRPMGAAPSELVAERLLGPYTAAASRDVTYAVDLGPDQVGKAQVKEARIALYDDALPRSITVALAGASAGVVAFLIGTFVLLFGGMRARRCGTRRRPIV